MKLWVDADAAPREVKEVVFRAAKRLRLETILVANQRMQTPVGVAEVSAVVVEGVPTWPTATSPTMPRPATWW
jgi:uncharacterized protein YaiI (UPF0178 family)